MKFVNDVTHILKKNAPTIFSSTAIVGVVTTSYLSARATLQADKKLTKIHYLENDLSAEFPDAYSGTERRKRLVRDIKECWVLYIPTAASGVITIGCIIGGTRVNNKRMAAAQAAFIISERAYSEYKDKVLETYGEGKEQKIRDAIVEDRIRANPPGPTIVLGSGSVLCREGHTGRYFESDMETLRRSVNDLNARLNHHDTCSLDDWYYLIGMPGTANSGDLGWHSDHLLSLVFTSVLTEDGRPCLSFDYDPHPRPLYI